MTTVELQQLVKNPHLFSLRMAPGATAEGMQRPAAPLTPAVNSWTGPGSPYYSTDPTVNPYIMPNNAANPVQLDMFGNPLNASNPMTASLSLGALSNIGTWISSNWLLIAGAVAAYFFLSGGGGKRRRPAFGGGA